MASLAPFGCLFLILKFMSTFDVVVFGAVVPDPMVAATDKLLKAQSEIIGISEMANSTSMYNLHDRLSALEGEFKQLNDLADLRKEANSSCEVALQMLTIHYAAIDAQLKKLQTLVEERTQQEDNKAIADEVVKAVRSNYFKLADEKLLQLGDLARIPNVVHEIYAGSEANFEAVVTLAKVLSKISVSFEVLKALYHEMQVSGHQNPLNLIILAEAFQSEVLKQHSNPDAVREAASSIVADLAPKIKTQAIEFLAKDLTAGGATSYAEGLTLLALMNEFSPELSIEVIQLLIDAVYLKVDSNKILDFLANAATSQAAFGVKTLFWTLKDNGKIQDKSIVKLASLLSKVQKRPDYGDLTTAQREDLDKIVDLLPTCAKNLFFSPTVCIWSKTRTTYLEASNKSYAHDKSRRNVFTLPPSNDSTADTEIPVGAPWIVHEINDHILFKSATYPDEYLYTAEIIFTPETRYVFTWIPGDNTDQQSFFSVELDGDFCYLKSERFKQYLYASEVAYSHPGGYSYVNTWTATPPKDRSMFLWQIRKC